MRSYLWLRRLFERWIGGDVRPLNYAQSFMQFLQIDLTGMSVCLFMILIGWPRVTRVRLGEMFAYAKHLVRVIGMAIWFARSLTFMCAHYVGIKGGCGVSFDAPVKVTSYLTCYIADGAEVVYRLDEVRENNRSLMCFSLMSIAHIREKTASAVTSAFLLSVLNFALIGTAASFSPLAI